jgi:hypothetical protein
MTEPRTRRRPTKLSAETKGEIFLQVTAGEITQADAARKWQVDVRGWIIDFAPGSEWPQIDVHEGEERYFVLSGEIIEGDLRYTAGTHVVFDHGSSHRPRSDVGCRIIGLNITPPS